MIYDKLCNIERYRGLNANIDHAIEFIMNQPLRVLVPGRNDVYGDQVFINCAHYATAPYGNDTLYEVHTQYADLHLLLSGKESVIISPAKGLKMCKSLPEEDADLYQGTKGDALTLDPDMFIILFPGEIHAAKVATECSVPVEKLVFKVAIN